MQAFYTRGRETVVLIGQFGLGLVNIPVATIGYRAMYVARPRKTIVFALLAGKRTVTTTLMSPKGSEFCREYLSLLVA